MNYTATASNALRAIKAKGKSYTLRRATVSTSASAPWKQSSASNTDETVYAVREEFTADEVDGENVKRSDLQLMVAASGLSVTPIAGDRIIDGATSYRVVNVDTLMPASTAITHTLQIRE